MPRVPTPIRGALTEGGTALAGRLIIDRHPGGIEHPRSTGSIVLISELSGRALGAEIIAFGFWNGYGSGSEV